MHFVRNFIFPALLVATACRSTSEQPEIAFERVMSSQVGFSMQPKNAVIRSDEEWREICKLNSPGMEPPTLKVDWSNSMLIVVGLGERPSGGYGVAIDSVTRQGSHWIVRARETRPAPGSLQATIVTSPFDCVRTPRFDGRVSFTVE